MSVDRLARLLPGVSELKARSKSIAMLEAILCPAPERRRYFFAVHGLPDAEVAVMSSGSGDEYSIAFTRYGACIRGFDHESVMSPYRNDGPWPGVLDSVPELFRGFVEGDANCDENGMPVVTVCLWRENRDTLWRTGDIIFPEGSDDPDGALKLLGLLASADPPAFQRYAEDQYGVPVADSAVRHIYDLRPLTEDVVARLNAQVAMEDLELDISNIGYGSV